MEKQSNINDKRAVKLENVMSPDFIPFLQGRPQRAEAINKQDQLDLAIALNTSDTVEDFLKILNS